MQIPFGRENGGTSLPAVSTFIAATFVRRRGKPALDAGSAWSATADSLLGEVRFPGGGSKRKFIVRLLLRSFFL
jgi:hypothetical protein